MNATRIALSIFSLLLPLSMETAWASDLVSGVESTIRSIPSGTGYAAHDLCTRTNVSGDDFASIRDAYVAPKVQPLPSYWVIANTPGSRVNVSALMTYSRIGVYRKGMGCTIVKNALDEFSLRLQPFKPVAVTAASNSNWPQGEGAVEGMWLSDSQKAVLDHHATTIFAETTTDPALKTNAVAFLVAKDGHLVYERYAANYNRSQPQLGWSMTKTLTALVAGRMEQDRLISLNAPVGLKQWQGTPKAVITWGQLLNMAPGLAWTEDYTGGAESDTTEMLYNQMDQARWAANHALTSIPGTMFNYSTGFSNIAMLGMREKLGGSHQSLHDYYQGKLFAPLGIRNGIIEPDASGTPVGGARGVLRPVDWLRLGQLVANYGIWNGERLLSQTYMNYFFAPSPASIEYGGSVWRHPSTAIPADLRARLPSDMVWFAGHMGQFMVIAPSRNLVVLRMGVAFDKALARNQVFATVADLLDQMH